MLKQQSICCLCKQNFTSLSQPRMMPHCEHSSCTFCLKHFINSKTTKITCSLCKQEEVINDVDLEYFPKNIILNKKLKDKIQFQFSKKQEGGDTQESIGSQVQRNFCQLHKMELQIVCMTDRTRICSHCALFGTHREHTLKTVKELNLSMEQKQKEFHEYCSRKHLLDQKIASEQFKQQIVSKITQQKNSLIKQIRKKFIQLTQNIKLAQKNLYEDLAKRFKTINTKISSILKEQNEVQRQYKVWQHKCKDVIEKAQKCKRLQEKLFYYFNGPLQICKKGEVIVQQLQKKNQMKVKAVQDVIDKIKIVENQKTPNSLFNYINIVIENQEQMQSIKTTSSTPVVVTPKRVKTQQCKMSIQFNSEPLIKEPESPVHKHRRSALSGEKTRDNRDRSVLKRRNSKIDQQPQNIQQVVTQFLQKQMDTLDLTGQNLSDYQIIEVLAFVKNLKKLKGLKLVKNRLTTEGFVKILELIPAVTNMNISYNQLTDDSISQLLTYYNKVPQLRIINLSNNKINQRRSKNIIQHLKRQGIIVTL